MKIGAMRAQEAILKAIDTANENKDNLSVVAKIAFFGAWLNPNNDILSEQEKESIQREMPLVNSLAKQWRSLSKYFKSNGRILEDFRLALETNLLASFRKLSFDEQYQHIEKVESLMTKAGVYDKRPYALTAPDPQLSNDVRKLRIKLEAKHTLNVFVARFNNMTNMMQQKVIAIFSSGISNQIKTRFTSSLQPIEITVRQSENKQKIDFLEALLANSKCQKLDYLFNSRAALLSAWSALRFRDLHPIRRNLLVDFDIGNQDQHSDINDEGNSASLIIGPL